MCCCGATSGVAEPDGATGYLGLSAELPEVTVPTVLRDAPPSHRVAHALAQKRVRGDRHYWRAARALARRPATSSLVIDGAPVTLDLSIRGEQHFHAGTYERAEMHVAGRLVARGATCVDAGANIGIYTALFSQRAGPAGRVLALEPSPAVLPRLRTLATRLGNVDVEPVAVGASDATLPLVVPGTGHGQANLRGELKSTGVSFDVHVRRLDQLAEEYGIERIDMAKVDVEGFEGEVVTGGGALFSERRIAAALIELSPAWSDHDVVRVLRGFGYRVYRVVALGGRIRWRPGLREIDRTPSDQCNVVAVAGDVPAAIDDLVVD